MVIQGERNNILLENRAAIIIYKFLVSLKKKPKRFILPVNICPIVYETFKKAFVPVDFVDIDPFDFCINKSKVLELIKNEEYSGMLFNYSYGLNKNFSEFFLDIRKKTTGDFVIIEDKCLCKPEVKIFDNVISDLIIYSTGYSKYVELNYGGYGVFQSDYKINLQKYNSLNGNIEFRGCGEASLQELNFVHEEYFVKIQGTLKSISEHKEKLNKIYSHYLNDETAFLGRDYNDWRFNIEVEKKDVVLGNIFKSGLFASSHYKPLDEDPATFSCAYSLSNKVLNLFNDFHFTEDQAIRITKVINDSF